MAERLPSWENMARKLALRLANHAYCPDHPESAPSEICPFCDDRATYRLWQRKAGAKPQPSEPAASIDVFAWNRAARAAERAAESEGGKP